jgi:dipeptidyl aminopeptidase/acylaminoacyl peptidase
MALPPKHKLPRLAAALLATAALPRAAQAAPPASAYVALPIGAGATLSPDGRAIATISTKDGKQAFVILHLDGTPPKIFSAGAWVPSAIFWKTSDLLIAYVHTTQQIGSHGYSIAVANMLAIAADGSKVTQIKVASTGIASMLPSDPDHILVQQNGGEAAAITSVDLRNGKTTDQQIFRTDAAYWYLDGNAKIRGFMQGRGPSMFRRNIEANIFARTGEDASWHRVTRDIVDGKLGYKFAGFSPTDPDQIYLLTNGAGPGQYAIIRAWSITTGQPGDIIAQSPGRDIEPILDHGALIGWSDGNDDAPATYLDPAWRHDAELIHHALGHGKIVLVSRSRDGKRTLARVHQGAMPAEYWLLDRTSGKTSLRSIIQTYETITPNDVAPARWVSYPARDGMVIPALLTLPPNHPAGPIPFVVLPHGGPSAHDELGFYWLAQFIASRGYGVLQPQFRGSTGFGSALHDAGLRNWGLAMQDDVTDGTKYVIAQHIADPKRICIVGTRYGGYAALEGAVKEPALYRCAAAFAPVTNLPQIVSIGNNNSDLDLPFPDSDKETLQKVSPVNGVDRITIPILLVHGTDDFTVQVEQSRQMERALKAAGKNVKAIYLENTGHYLSTAASRLALLQSLELFLAAHLTP